jgi:uncharacterized protein YodC (DUF2158 family)
VSPPTGDAGCGVASDDAGCREAGGDDAGGHGVKCGGELARRLPRCYCSGPSPPSHEIPVSHHDEADILFTPVPNKEDNWFDVGDVVQLKSGGSAMTVDAVTSDAPNDSYRCVWMDAVGVLQQGTFYGRVLKACDVES